MKKIFLRDDQMPTQWYNVVPDLPSGLRPPLDLVTWEPEKPQTILSNFSRHGLIDMAAYDRYCAGKIKDCDYPEVQIATPLAGLPNS